jgi:hypothetical protein
LIENDLKTSRQRQQQQQQTTKLFQEKKAIKRWRVVQKYDLFVHAFITTNFDKKYSSFFCPRLSQLTTVFTFIILTMFLQ